MKSQKTVAIIRRIYDDAQGALWAIACALVLYTTFVVLPHAPELRAAAQRERILEVSAENRLYCEKLGMKTGTPKYLQCTLDLGEFRQKIESRIAEENEF